MSIKQIKVGNTTHDIHSVYDGNGNNITNTYLPKLTYEWNKSYNAGGTAGYLLIGSFPMYDSNLTIDIDSTTNTTYHGTVVIATQNVSTTSMGSAHTITVYGDPTGTISNAIRVVWTSGSRNYNVYFVPSTWSKNLIHIRAIGNYLEETDVSKICTQFTTGTAPATTSGLTVTNALTSAFNLTKDKVTTALGYTPPTTNTTYGVVSTTANGLAPKRDGSTTKYLRADGTWAVPPDNNTTYSAATTSTAGLMSAADKIKLNGIATGANNYTYTLPAATSSALGGVKIGSNITVSSGTISLTKSNVTTALGYTPPTSNTNTTYTFATGDSNGQIKVTPSGGSAQNISVKGLGSAAYTASTDYMNLTSAQTAKGVKTFTNGIKIGSANLTYDTTKGALVISF